MPTSEEQSAGTTMAESPGASGPQVPPPAMADAKGKGVSAPVAPELPELPGPEPDAKGKGITPPPPVELDGSDGEADGLPTCAICLNRIPVEDTAQPEGCEHVYCACCILHWAVFKEKAWCPQCKAPFAGLLTYRTLDGQLRDFPVREAVCLLKRAQWFQDHVKAKEALAAEAARPGSAGLGWPEGSVIDESDYVDYARYYDEYDDDEEVENYYFSSAAGRARVIGNRRHGPNGFISSGRLQARPAAPQQPPSKGKKGAKAAGSGGEATPARGKAPRGASPSGSPHTPAVPGGRKHGGSASGSAASGSDGCPGGSGCSQQSAGRRARRNQRRAAADAKVGLA